MQSSAVTHDDAFGDDQDPVIEKTTNHDLRTNEWRPLMLRGLIGKRGLRRIHVLSITSTVLKKTADLDEFRSAEAMYPRSRWPTRDGPLRARALHSFSRACGWRPRTPRSFERLATISDAPDHELRLLASETVHDFTDEVSVAVMTCVLLDHVTEDPAQTWRASVGPDATTELIQIPFLHRLCNQSI